MSKFTEKTSRELQLENLIIAAEIEAERRTRHEIREAMINEQLRKNLAAKQEKEFNAQLLVDILCQN